MWRITFAGEELLRAGVFLFSLFSLFNGFALVMPECVWFVWWVLFVLFVFGCFFLSTGLTSLLMWTLITIPCH